MDSSAEAVDEVADDDAVGRGVKDEAKCGDETCRRKLEFLLLPLWW